MKTPRDFQRSGACLTLCLCMMFVLAAQAAHAQMFQKTYNAPLAQEYDVVAQSVRQTADGGYITAGYITDWAGNTRVALSKTTAAGVLQWSREIRTPTNPEAITVDAGLCVRELVDNGVTTGYYIVGSAEYNGAYRILVIRTNATGGVQWRRLYWGNQGDAIAYSFEIVRNPLKPADDHLIITGSINNAQGDITTKGERIFLMRLFLTGGLVWCRQFGVAHAADPNMPEENVGLDVRPLEEGGYVLTGFCSDGVVIGNRVPCIIQTNSNGNWVWGNTYPGPAGLFSQRWGVGKAIDRTNDGGFIVTGQMNTFTSTGLDVFLLRVNVAGGLGWLKTYDAMNTSETHHADKGYDIIVEGNGSYTVAGITPFSEIGNTIDHPFLMSVSSDGNTVLWEIQYSFSNATFFGFPLIIDPTVGLSMHKCTDGGYIIESMSHWTGLYLIRTNALGASGGCEDIPTFYRTDRSTLPVSVPQVEEENGQSLQPWQDPPLSLTEATCEALPKRSPGLNVPGAPGVKDLSVAPNVLREGEPLAIRLNRTGDGAAFVRVLDMLGRMVYEGSIDAAAAAVTMPTDGWSAGIYRIEVAAGDTRSGGSVMVVK